MSQCHHRQSECDLIMIIILTRAHEHVVCFVCVVNSGVKQKKKKKDKKEKKDKKKNKSADDEAPSHPSGDEAEDVPEPVVVPEPVAAVEDDEDGDGKKKKKKKDKKEKEGKKEKKDKKKKKGGDEEEAAAPPDDGGFSFSSAPAPSSHTNGFDSFGSFPSSSGGGGGTSFADAFGGPSAPVAAQSSSGGLVRTDICTTSYQTGDIIWYDRDMSTIQLISLLLLCC